MTKTAIDHLRECRYVSECPACQERINKLEAVVVAARSFRAAIDEYGDAHPNAATYPWPALDIAFDELDAAVL